MRHHVGLWFLVFIVFAASGTQAADEPDLQGDFVQGGLVQGRTVPGAEVRLGERRVRVSADGRFILGFGRDAAASQALRVTLPDGTVVARTLTVAPRDYAVQRIDGLPPSKVTPPAEVLARIKREAAEIRAVRDRDRPERGFDSGFIWPVTGRISGVFGSQRILNGEPRQPHYGIDIAAPAGTPVVAPADGVVTYRNADMYFSGGTLMIDHGQGLMSGFLHLQSIAVAEGQPVAQGETIGTVGATGRATGPHLDWRVNWFQERLDAGLLVPPMPAPKAAQD
ncbi:MAG: M23 family metallopeptidase [Kiloniellales bacterium]|nr:M23 family metallopeptidase [Kiloniellales bacterium]